MKLHLGCGRRHIPCCVHIDVLDHPHVDQVSSIDNLSFLQGARVLVKRYRVLTPGGVLRVSVPDFAALKTQLGQVGFCEVRRYDRRETERAHIDDFAQAAYIPHMDKEHGVLISLNVECRRPPN
jgi:predicted SAM-dependent methyltransferase